MSNRRRSALIATLAMIGAGWVAGPSSTRAAAVPDDFFGIHAVNLFELGKQRDGEALDRHVEAIKDAGLSWARVNLDWHQIEPWRAEGDHVYDWKAADRMMAALARHGVEPVPHPWSSPYWAREPISASVGCRQRSAMPARFASDYGDFVEATMHRYGRGGEFWAAYPDLPAFPVERVELWNEPNHRGFWCPTPDPETFSAFLAAGAQAAKQADPKATVVLGGLVMNRNRLLNSDGTLRTIATDEFINRMLAREPKLKTLLDEVGIHPYAPTASQSIDLISWLRRNLEAAGLGDAGLLVTEFGWPTQGEWSVTEEQRVARYDDYVDKLPHTDCKISGMAPSVWASREEVSGYREHWFGIANPVTAELHPTGEAYKAQIAALREADSVPTTLTACATRPRIRIVNRSPRRSRVRAAAVRFRVRGSESATGQCRVDRGRWRRSCEPLFRARRLKPGRHVVRIRARDGKVRSPVRTLPVRVLRRR